LILLFLRAHVGTSGAPVFAWVPLPLWLQVWVTALI
jgi:hypothetical protein